jgi:copper homeostasis protein
MPFAGVLLEVSVDSPAGFKAAVSGGADRIELCSSLSLGGLTPSPGLMSLAAGSPCPSRAMIRPRVGGFTYSEDEIDVMRRDIDAVRAAGLAGVVIGANLPSGRLDEEVLARLTQHASGLEIALHRSIDLTPEPLLAVDLARQLGIHTILTSGGRASAIDGAETIATLTRRAGADLEILAGSGLKPDNVARFVEMTGVRAIHGSCSAPWQDPEPRALRFGFITAEARETDLATVRHMKRVLSQLS